MKRICSWCNKELKPREEYASEGGITHGICSLCALKFDGLDNLTIREMLEFVEEPVFVVDQLRIVKAANESAAKLLGKKIDDIEGALGGDAFGCVYSQLEGGCGNTIHCKTCAVRNIVMDTLSTGHGFTGVPAFQNIQTKEGPTLLKFTVSTEKVGERILLRIDRVN